MGAFCVYTMDLKERYNTALFVRDEFKDFKVFATVAMQFLGFPITPMQLDIADYMATGNPYRMVMAQRGR